MGASLRLVDAINVIAIRINIGMTVDLHLPLTLPSWGRVRGITE